MAAKIYNSEREMPDSPVIYIMGVSGSGKTTIGQKLSQLTGLSFYDADDFHSVDNKSKMKSGQALDDLDRKEWLENVHLLAEQASRQKGAIIACSALKTAYRQQLVRGIDSSVHWIFLEGDYGLILERMKARKDHFMPPALLRSQFDTLEKPTDALAIDIGQDPDEIVKLIIRTLALPSRVQ